MLKLIGVATINSLTNIGKMSLFFYEIISCIFQSKWYPKEFLKQCYKVGFLSLAVVGFTAIFTGGVIALQTYIGASRYSVNDVVPSLVVLTITRELAPILTSLIVVGRVSSTMSAELGTMLITEQIDALKTLSTDPIKYLVIPRIASAVITLPLLVLVADIIGVFGGYLTSVYTLNFNSSIYLMKTISFLQLNDVVSGLLKSIMFGFIVAFIGCYYGYNSGKGAEGVGKSTTNAVVVASILIFIFNFVLTKLFFL